MAKKTSLKDMNRWVETGSGITITSKPKKVATTPKKKTKKVNK